MQLLIRMKDTGTWNLKDSCSIVSYLNISYKIVLPIERGAILHRINYSELSMDKVLALLLNAIVLMVLVAESAMAQEGHSNRIKAPEVKDEYRVFDPLRDRYFGDFVLSIGAHARISSNNYDNLPDLDDDAGHPVWYIGYEYDIEASLKHESSAELFLQLKRNNISLYDAPLIRNSKIITLFGTRHEYTQGEMLPRVSRLYFDVPVTDFLETRVRAGFFNYLVGNGYALGGKYPDLAATLSVGPENLRGRLNYTRVDMYNRQKWGPKILHGDEKAFSGKHVQANFYAADLMAKVERHTIQPYIGILHDFTRPKHRANNFDDFNLNGTRINNDILGTVGIDVNLNFERFDFGVEFARNFGKAYSSDKTEANRGDITHKGWLLLTDAGYNLGIVRPTGRFIWASGPKSSREDFNDFRVTSRTNRTFSIYSPTNINLFNAHFPKTGIGPYVATGYSYLLNFGIDRPGVFGDPFVIENIIYLNGGLEFFPIDKSYLSVNYWNMHADEPGFGLNSENQTIKLPSELGHEIDVYASYEVTRRFSVNLQGGVFFPGKNYRQDRGDSFDRGNLGYTPVLPRDKKGDPDNAYILSLGFEYSF